MKKITTKLVALGGALLVAHPLLAATMSPVENPAEVSQSQSSQPSQFSSTATNEFFISGLYSPLVWLENDSEMSITTGSRTIFFPAKHEPAHVQLGQFNIGFLTPITHKWRMGLEVGYTTNLRNKIHAYSDPDDNPFASLLYLKKQFQLSVLGDYIINGHNEVYGHAGGAMGAAHYRFEAAHNSFSTEETLLGFTLGVGYRYNINARFSANAECDMNRLFTRSTGERAYDEYGTAFHGWRTGNISLYYCGVGLSVKL